MPELSWAKIRQAVYDRASGCCEYCQTCEVNIGQTMQVDHIDPLGGDTLDNLALACWSCNNHKRQAITAIDPQTNQTVRLFHPRKDEWKEHFQWSESSIHAHGLTAIGRATIARLKMNRAMIVVARKRWVEGGYHPPEKLSS